MFCDLLACSSDLSAYGSDLMVIFSICRAGKLAGGMAGVGKESKVLFVYFGKSLDVCFSSSSTQAHIIYHTKLKIGQL